MEISWAKAANLESELKETTKKNELKSLKKWMILSLEDAMVTIPESDTNLIQCFRFFDDVGMLG